MGSTSVSILKVESVAGVIVKIFQHSSLPVSSHWSTRGGTYDGLIRASDNCYHDRKLKLQCKANTCTMYSVQASLLVSKYGPGFRSIYQTLLQSVLTVLS